MTVIQWVPTPKRQRRRYRQTTASMYPLMLELYRQGYGYIRIGQMLNCHPVTVGNYIRSVVPAEQRRKRGNPNFIPNRNEP